MAVPCFECLNTLTSIDRESTNGRSCKILMCRSTRDRKEMLARLFFFFFFFLQFFPFLFCDNFTTYWCTRKCLPWSVRRTWGGGARWFLTWMNVSAFSWFAGFVIRVLLALFLHVHVGEVLQASACEGGPRDKLLVVGKPTEEIIFIRFLLMSVSLLYTRKRRTTVTMHITKRDSVIVLKRSEKFEKQWKLKRIWGERKRENIKDCERWYNRLWLISYN